MGFLNLLIVCVYAAQLSFAATGAFRRAYSNSTAGVIPAAEKRGDHELGYAQYLTSGHTADYEVTAWPLRRGLWGVNEGYRRIIPYCYVDQRTEELMERECLLGWGSTLWAQSLGGKASRENGHSLSFLKPRRSNQYCCRSYHYGEENEPMADDDFRCDWDHDNWPSDTLAIHWADISKTAGLVAEASVGYWPIKEDPKAEPGRHWMRVTDDADHTDIAHELGHVLGMVHEHQRWDRDDHIEYRCHNLYHIHEMSVSVEQLALDKHITHDEALNILCEDINIARDYHALSAGFIKGDGLDPNTKPEMDGPGGFDMESIMLYDSESSSVDGATVDTAVLVGFRKDAQGNKIPGSQYMYPQNLVPSRLDALFVRRFYPWEEDKYQEWKRLHPQQN